MEAPGFSGKDGNGTSYRKATTRFRTRENGSAPVDPQYRSWQRLRWAAQLPAAAEGKGFQAVAVNHISYVCADYAKTRDFYADLLGMKVSHDDGKQCYMSFGDTFLLPRNARTGGKTPQTTPLISHIAYTIDNWDKKAVEAELRRRGSRAASRYRR